MELLLTEKVGCAQVSRVGRRQHRPVSSVLVVCVAVHLAQKAPRSGQWVYTVGAQIDGKRGGDGDDLLASHDILQRHHAAQPALKLCDPHLFQVGQG